MQEKNKEKERKREKVKKRTNHVSATSRNQNNPREHCQAFSVTMAP